MYYIGETDGKGLAVTVCDSFRSVDGDASRRDGSRIVDQNEESGTRTAFLER
jgi:hypothetical protein